MGRQNGGDRNPHIEIPKGDNLQQQTPSFLSFSFFFLSFSRSFSISFFKFLRNLDIYWCISCPQKKKSSLSPPPSPSILGHLQTKLPPQF